MAGTAKTHYCEKMFLNFIGRGVLPSTIAQAYAGLFTSDPGESGSGAEVSGGGYTRIAVTFNAPVDQSPTGSRMETSADATFPTATLAWGTVTHLGIFDASTGGNLLYYKVLPDARTVVAGDVIKIAAGDLAVTED